MLRRARERGVAPHILRLGCDEYQRLLGTSGQLDHIELLAVVTRHLGATATRVLRHRGRRPSSAPYRRRLVVLYGGALHNDLYPREELESFSYAAKLQPLVGERYVELDLFVPEYVAGQELVKHEPWYPLVARARPDRVLLVRRGERSYAMILRSGVQ